MSDERIHEKLDEIISWLKFQNTERLRQMLGDLSGDDKIIYHLADGNHSVRDIEKHIEGSTYVVSSRLQEWEGLGLVRKNEAGAWEHIVPFESVGLESPSVEEE